MKILKLEEIESWKNTEFEKAAITIGTFDGVHSGHLKILNKLKEQAKKNKTYSVVFTFDPHPRKIIFPNEASPKLLNTRNEKTELLEKAGVDILIICKFDKKFASLSSESFVNKYLKEKFAIKTLIMGYDHKIGADKETNPEKLKKYFLLNHLNISKINPLEINNVRVSSTKIRNCIINGEIEKANLYLTYNYNISGKVVGGEHIGRKLGFPTANLSVSCKDKLIPKNGVYKVFAEIDKILYKGMLNIGIRPTFSDKNNKTIEVHLFDTDKNLYDKKIKVFFDKFIRNEIKFSCSEELVKQLKIDKIASLCD